MQKNLKGFTLIELLVVIAIIGILSGLIIVSMSGATNSAKDARIKEDLHQLQQLAAVYSNAGASTYGSGAAGANTNFTGVGEGLTVYTDLISSALGSKALTLTLYSVSGVNAFCMYIPLNALSGSNTQYQCIDSAGNVKTTTATTVCAGTNNVICQ